MTVSHDGKTKVVSGKRPVPRLVVRKGLSLGKDYPILKEEISIGRSPECEVSVNDNNMSRKHARIVFLAGIFFVYDNESLNGTFLNGKKVVEAQLSSGDIIKIGETEFEFEFEKAKKAESFPKFGEQIDRGIIDDKDLPPPPVPKEGKRARFYTVSLLIIGVMFVGMMLVKKYKTAQLSQAKASRDARSSISTATPTPVLTPNVIQKPLEEATSTTYYSQGLLAMTAGEYREALSLFQKTLEADPTHESAPLKIENCRKIIDSMIRNFFKEGLREYEIRYYERAIAQWSRVLTLASGYDEEMYSKAQDRIKEARLRLARQDSESEQ